jgi:hypothetical protein
VRLNEVLPRPMNVDWDGNGVADAYDEWVEVFNLEAYPVDPESPSYRFMGYVETFRAAGYREVGRAGSRRHVYRKLLFS